MAGCRSQALASAFSEFHKGSMSDASEAHLQILEVTLSLSPVSSGVVTEDAVQASLTMSAAPRQPRPHACLAAGCRRCCTLC